MKKVYSLFFTLMLLMLVLLPAGTLTQAAGELPNVIDEADIFNPEEEAKLNQDMRTAQEKYGSQIVILTVTRMQRAELEGGKLYYDIQAFAEDYYDYVYSGGVKKDGIILCINMEANNREFCIVPTGKEIDRFQKKMNYIYDRIYENMHRTEYDKAGRTFLNLVVTRWKLGFFPPSWGTVALCLGIGGLAGWIVTKGMKAGMNNVKTATSAGSYLVPGSFTVRRQNDLFLYSHITQTARQTDRDNSGGGGGIHIGSSGISHGGGGGRSF
ncbi:MAG: TPM domain-containing protein [Lachnospiraceae bacterium]|nr:TPM domain-containing protein [Lachnospiraceae bacterium]